MASQWIFLERTVSAPELNSTSLDKPFAPGQSITFVSTSFDPTADTTVGLDSAGFYFTKGNDVLLDIAIRRSQNRILFNTRQGGTWGHEQSVRLQDVFPGPHAIVHVTANATTYNISFNDSSNIHTFTKVIQGDPTGVLYFEDNSRPVFSNPVVTAVFGVYIFLSALIAPVYSYAFRRKSATTERIRGRICPMMLLYTLMPNPSHESDPSVDPGSTTNYLRRIFFLILSNVGSCEN